MFDTLYMAILRDMVLFSGMIISWLYWRRQSSERDDFIADLQTNIKDKNANLGDSEMRLQEQEAELENINTKLSQTEETVSGLIKLIKEKDNSINLLKEQAADLKKQNQDTTTRAENAEARVEDLKKSTQEQATKIQNLNTNLSQSEKAIRGLTVQIKEKDNSINLFKKTIADLEKRNQDTMTRAEDAEARAEELKKRTQEQETKINSLNTQLSQREEAIRGLTAQNMEKENSINLLKEQAADLEKQNQDTTTRAEDAEARAEDLKMLTQEQETRIESLNTLSNQREETISDLTAQNKEKENSINLFKDTIADLEKQNQNTIIRAEQAEARIIELENSIETKEKEIAALIARSRARQDNFAYIAGIGPKVSTILRSAGIDTFAQLAATHVKKIREILEAENPSLLRLTDPTTWAEQAKLAAKGDWDALSALQEKLKESRRA